MSKETTTDFNNSTKKESEKTKKAEHIETVKKSDVNKDEKETKTVKEKKMGVVRFLQLNPQSFIVASLLKSEFGQKVMLESEWKETLDKLMKKHITK